MPEKNLDLLEQGPQGIGKDVKTDNPEGTA